MNILGLIAIIFKSILFIAVAIISIVIVLIIILSIFDKKDNEKKNIVREADELNADSINLLNQMLNDGKITEEKIKSYRKRIRTEKIREFRDIEEQADAGVESAIKQQIELLASNKLTDSLIIDIKDVIMKEKEEQNRKEEEKERIFIEQKNKVLNYFNDLPHMEDRLKLVLDCALEVRSAYHKVLPGEMFTISISREFERINIYNEHFTDRRIIKIEILVGNWYESLLNNYEDAMNALEVFDYYPNENIFVHKSIEIGRTEDTVDINENDFKRICSFLNKYSLLHDDIKIEYKSYGAIIN